ncbi:MAG: hypothetical protein VKK05_09245, partial [Synechococcus sp.]|nr:hypothetical protein [Synechococcus sp.]
KNIMSNINEPYDEDDNYEDDAKYYPDGGMYKHYFKFDAAAWDAWGKWLYDAMKDIVESDPNVWYTPTYVEGWPTKKFPVNSYFPNTGKDQKTFQYLGNNYDGQAIWKKKYFVSNPIQTMYIDHLSNHAAYFIRQPHYYKGMFDILN